jgi:hypothetical protein
MNNRLKNVLKGQQTLAQGKRRRSVALGYRISKRIVRAITSIKEKFTFRTKEMTSCFHENVFMQFRPKEMICFVHRIPADGFRLLHFTRGGVSDRSSLNFAPGYCHSALSGRNKSH